MTSEARPEKAVSEDTFGGVVHIRRPGRPPADIAVSTREDAEVLLREIDGEDAAGDLVPDEPWDVETEREHDPVAASAEEDAYSGWDE